MCLIDPSDKFLIYTKFIKKIVVLDSNLIEFYIIVSIVGRIECVSETMV